jgi:DNA-binding transcriptional MerR regulator
MGENNQLFTILQVSEKLKVPKPTLRFWERELPGTVVPLRTPGGQRRYTSENLLVLEEIKRYRESGLSLSEILEKVQPARGNEEILPNKIDLLATQVAEVVKREVYSFFKKEKG